MKRKLDIENWNRKEHFHFFKNFTEPFWGTTVQVNCTEAYKYGKQHGISFYALYTYAITRSINETENLRYRILGDEVWVFETIHLSSTIGRTDGTFGFSFVKYSTDFEVFTGNLKSEIEEVNKCSGIRFLDEAKRLDYIHFSTIPWFEFTSLSHARNHGFADSVPKISVGKFFTENDTIFLPVSIHVHHGLADGYHVGLFFETLQKLLLMPEDLLINKL